MEELKDAENIKDRKVSGGHLENRGKGGLEGKGCVWDIEDTQVIDDMEDMKEMQKMEVTADMKDIQNNNYINNQGGHLEKFQKGGHRGKRGRDGHRRHVGRWWQGNMKAAMEDMQNIEHI